MKNFVLSILVLLCAIVSNSQSLPIFQWVPYHNFYLARLNPNTFQEKDLIFIDTNYVNNRVENFTVQGWDSTHGWTGNYNWVLCVNDSGTARIMPLDSIIRNCYPRSNPAGYLTTELDGSSANEIQTISRSNGTVKLSINNSEIHLPDSSDANELELPSQTANAGRDLRTNGTNVSWGKRQETYSGSTNGSGNYTISFSNTFSQAPNIQANIVGGSNTNIIKITSITTTGFTVNVVNRVDVIGLLPSYSNVSGASVDVIITEK